MGTRTGGKEVNAYSNHSGGVPCSLWTLLGLLATFVCISVVLASVNLGLTANQDSGTASSADVKELSDQITGLLEAADIAAAPTDCETIIVGYGPGGAYTGYRLAPKLGAGLCIIDERNHPGGKVLSVPLPQSTPSNPLYTPTHAEQFRQSDVALRCLAQSLGVPAVARGSVVSHVEGILRGANYTGVDCFGNNTVTGAPACAAGFTTDRLAPNGDFPATYAGALPACDNNADDWTACSYCDEYFDILMNQNNVNTITPGETFEAYARRLLRQPGLEFWTDTCGYPYPITSVADARAYIEYLRYDWVTPSYDLLLLQVGGPQALWKKVHARILGNQSRVFMNEKVNDVSLTTGSSAKSFRYTVKTASGNTYRGKRVVLAIPALAIQQLSGNVASQIKSSKFVQFNGYNEACTWNAAWETRWWNPDRTTCNAGYCTTRGVSGGAFTIDQNAVARNFSVWSFSSDMGVPFAQYVGTPERQDGNLLRVFLEDADCHSLNYLLENGGQGAVTTEMLARLRNIFGQNYVPDPLSGFYSYEEAAYQLTRPGAGFTAKQMMDWAKQPLTKEKVVVVGESFNPLDAGWQDAAITSAHNAFRGQVFQDLYQPGDVNGWERCSNRFTNRDLIKGNQQSEHDLCLLLENEYHMRDLAGLNYCGGPSVITSETEEDGTVTSSSVENDWANAASEPVTDQGAAIHRRNRYNVEYNVPTA